MNIIVSKYILYLSKEIQYNLTNGELNEIKNFVIQQINLAPRHIRLLIFFLSHLLFLFYKFFVIVFNNNKNEFFALDERKGIIKWKQTLNSDLRPTYAEGLIFTVTLEGYLVLIDSRNGNIVRMTSIFENFKKYKKKNIKPEGFIVAKNEIYLSLNNGKLAIIDIANGRSKNVLKIDNEKISRPYVLNNKMYIVRNNAIIKLY